jgi:hypothetical protein
MQVSTHSDCAILLEIAPGGGLLQTAVTLILTFADIFRPILPLIPIETGAPGDSVNRRPLK